METKIVVVYDNCSNKPGLKKGWGFSALIKTSQAAPILFDTGNDGGALLYNMERLGIDPEQLGAVVISHAHSDHIGGLAEVLKRSKQATIFLPASVSAEIPGREVVHIDKSVEIANGVFSIGELKNIEQSLAVKTEKGIVVVTGCSHPGVGAILDAAYTHGKIYGIVGGLHGFHDFSRLKGLSLICPCHCTQYKKELEQLFPEQYLGCGAGLEIVL